MSATPATPATSATPALASSKPATASKKTSKPELAKPLSRTAVLPPSHPSDRSGYSSGQASPRYEAGEFESPEDAHLNLVRALKSGEFVYVATPQKVSAGEEAFLKCKVLKVADAVTVAMPSGESKTFAPRDIMPAGGWEPELEETNDLCALPSLNEATVLAALEHRYVHKVIYTWIANLLISINPCSPRCVPSYPLKLSRSAPVACARSH